MMDYDRLKEQFNNWLSILNKPNYELSHTTQSLDFRIKDPEIIIPLFDQINIDHLSQSQINDILLSPFGSHNAQKEWQRNNPELYETFSSDDKSLGERLCALLNMNEFRTQESLRHIVSTLVKVNDLEKVIEQGTLEEQKEHFTSHFPGISNQPSQGLKYLTPSKGLVAVMKSLQKDIDEAVELDYKMPKENPFRRYTQIIHSVHKTFHSYITPMIDVIEKGLNQSLSVSDYDSIGSDVIFFLPKSLRPISLLAQHLTESPKESYKLASSFPNLIKDYTDKDIREAYEDLSAYTHSLYPTIAERLQSQLATTVLATNKEIISILQDTSLQSTYNTLLNRDVADLIGLELPIETIIEAAYTTHKKGENEYPFMKSESGDRNDFFRDFHDFSAEMNKITDIIIFRHYLRTKGYNWDDPVAIDKSSEMIHEIAICLRELGVREVFNDFINEAKSRGTSLNKVMEANPIPMVGTGIHAAKDWLKKSRMNELMQDDPKNGSLFESIHAINEFALEISPHINLKGNAKPLLSIDNRVERMKHAIFKEMNKNANINDKKIDINDVLTNTL